MRSLTGGKLIVSKGRERGKCYTTSEKYFRFGSYLTCDYVLEHPQAKGVHCEIACDAFGRITVTTFCKTNSVYINGKPLRSTTRILSGATIKIFDETFVWDQKSNKRKSIKAERSLQTKTPDARIRRRSEAPNSAPDLRTARVRLHQRRTVHNLLNPLGINSNHDSKRKKSLTNKEISESETKTPQASEKEVKTQNPRVSSIKIDEDRRRITRSPASKLSLCKTSDLVVTSYSPVSKEAYVSRSFNSASRNDSNSTIYGTPDAVIISDCSDVELINSGSGTTPKSSKHSSVFLIDLLTPRKEIMHRTGSPLLKSVLKSSAKKVYNSMKLTRKGVIDVSDTTPFSHRKHISFRNNSATSNQHQPKSITRSGILHRRSNSAPATGLRKINTTVDTPRTPTCTTPRSIKVTKRLNYSQKGDGESVEKSKIESPNKSNGRITRKSLAGVTPCKSEIRDGSVEASPNRFASMATSTPLVKLNDLDKFKNKTMHSPYGSRILKSQNKSCKETNVSDVLLSRILKDKVPAKRHSCVGKEEPNVSKTEDKGNNSKNECNSNKNKLLNALREVKTANLIKQQSLREQFAIMSVNDTQKQEQTPRKATKANLSIEEEENAELSAAAKRKVGFQLSFDITEEEKENIKACTAVVSPQAKGFGLKKCTEKTPLREKACDLSGIKELLATPTSCASEVSKSRFEEANTVDFPGTPARTSICYRSLISQKTQDELNFSHGDKIFTSSASKRIMINGKIDEENEEHLQLSSKCIETIADDEESPSDIAGISIARLFESNKKEKKELQDEDALNKSEILTLDESFDQLLGKPIIKRDYSRHKTYSRSFGLPISPPENSCADLEKLDIQKWLDDVKVTTNTAKESVDIDSPCSKSKRISQLSISRISTVNILDDSVTGTQDETSAFIVSSQSTNGIQTPSKNSFKQEPIPSQLNESLKNQNHVDLKESNNLEELSLSSVRAQLCNSNHSAGSTLSLTKKQSRLTRSTNSLANEKNGSFGGFKQSPKSTKNVSFTTDVLKNQSQNGEENLVKQKSFTCGVEKEDENTDTTKQQHRRSNKFISLNETFDLGEVSENDEEGPLHDSSTEAIDNISRITEQKVVIGEFQCLQGGDDELDNEILLGNLSEHELKDGRKSEINSKENRSTLKSRRTIAPSPASPALKARNSKSQGLIEIVKQTAIARKSLAGKTIQENEVLPRRSTRSARKTMDELENISFAWDISKEQKEFEEAFENFKESSASFGGKSKAADEDLNCERKSLYSAAQSPLKKSFEVEKPNHEDANGSFDAETAKQDHEKKVLFENFSEQPSRTLRNGRKSDFYLLNSSVQRSKRLTMGCKPQNVSFDWKNAKEQREQEDAFENFLEIPVIKRMRGKSVGPETNQKVSKTRRTLHQPPISESFNVEDAKKQYEEELLFENFSEEPPISLRTDRKSVSESTRKRSLRNTRKTMGVKPDSESFDWNAARAQKDLREAFENFEDAPKPKVFRGKTLGPDEIVNNLKKSRKTVGQPPLNDLFDIEAAKKEHEKEMLFENFTEQPLKNLRSNRKSETNTIVAKSARTSRKTVGHNPQNVSFDWRSAKEQKEREEAFENFDEVPEPKAFRSKSIGPNEIATNLKKSRRTVGQQPLTKSFDIEAAKQEHEKEILFKNFTEQPLKSLRSNRKSETNTIFAKFTRTNRMTMGHNPQNVSFDWQSAKEQKEMEEAFENFAEIPEARTLRGKSQGPDEIQTRQTRNRRTVGQPPISELDIESAKYEYEKEVLFKNFSEEPLRNLRTNRKSEANPTENKSKKTDRMTMGHKPQNVSFDWQSAKENKEFEEAFENFNEIPERSTIRGKSQGPDEIAQSATRNRRTVGQPPLSESLDIEAVKEEYEREKLFENFSEEPIKNLKSTRKSENQAKENRSLRSARMTMGNEPRNISFDWQSAKKQKELEEAFENFKEIPEPNAIRGKSQEADEIPQRETRNRRTVGQPPLSESLDLEAAKDDYENEKLFENFSENPVKNLRSSRKSDINTKESRSKRSMRMTMGNNPRNISFDWETAKEQKEFEEAFENFKEASELNAFRGKSQGPDELMIAKETRNRRTVGQPPLSESLDIEAAKEEFEKEKLFENFSEMPLRKLESNRKSEVSVIEKKTLRNARMTLGYKPQDVSFDWQTAKEQKELEEAFENFNETSVPKTFRGKSQGPDEIPPREPRNRRTVGQPPLSESLDIEAAKEEFEKEKLFENFSEMPLRKLESNRKSEVSVIEKKTLRNARMTLGYKPQDVSFDWQTAKEQKELEEAFENFNETSVPKVCRGKSQGPDEIPPREPKSRRTVGQPPLSESLDIEAAKEEYEKEVLFENFSEKPLKNLRTKRKSEISRIGKKSKQTSRMTMGCNLQDVSFDWQSAKEQKDLEEAFENFQEIPEPKAFGGKSQGPDEIPAKETRNRRTVGRPPLSESFDIETAKEEHEREVLFENFSEKPLKVLRSNRKSEFNATEKSSERTTRMTMGYNPQNISFDWQSAREQKELQEAFENFKEAPEPRSIRGKSEGPEEILPREIRNRRTVGQPALSESLDIKAAKEEFEKEMLFENFSEEPVRTLRSGRKSEVNPMTKKTMELSRKTLGDKPLNVSFDWNSAREQKADTASQGVTRGSSNILSNSSSVHLEVTDSNEEEETENSKIECTSRNKNEAGTGTISISTNFKNSEPNLFDSIMEESDCNTSLNVSDIHLSHADEKLRTKFSLSKQTSTPMSLHKKLSFKDSFNDTEKESKVHLPNEAVPNSGNKRNTRKKQTPSVPLPTRRTRRMFSVEQVQTIGSIAETETDEVQETPQKEVVQTRTRRNMRHKHIEAEGNNNIAEQIVSASKKHNSGKRGQTIVNHIVEKDDRQLNTDVQNYSLSSLSTGQKTIVDIVKEKSLADETGNITNHSTHVDTSLEKNQSSVISHTHTENFSVKEEADGNDKENTKDLDTKINMGRRTRKRVIEHPEPPIRRTRRKKNTESTENNTALSQTLEHHTSTQSDQKISIKEEVMDQYTQSSHAEEPKETTNYRKPRRNARKNETAKEESRKHTDIEFSQEVQIPEIGSTEPHQTENDINAEVSAIKTEKEDNTEQLPRKLRGRPRKAAVNSSKNEEKLNDKAKSFLDQNEELTEGKSSATLENIEKEDIKNESLEETEKPKRGRSRKAVEMRVAVTKRNLRRKVETEEVNDINDDEKISKKRVRFANNSTLNIEIDTEKNPKSLLCSSDIVPAKIKSEQAVTVPNLSQSESSLNSIKTETENINIPAANADEMDISKGRKKSTKRNAKIEVILEKQAESNNAANEEPVADNENNMVEKVETITRRGRRGAAKDPEPDNEVSQPKRRGRAPLKKANLVDEKENLTDNKNEAVSSTTINAEPKVRKGQKSNSKTVLSVENEMDDKAESKQEVEHKSEKSKDFDERREESDSGTKTRTRRQNNATTANTAVTKNRKGKNGAKDELGDNNVEATEKNVEQKPETRRGRRKNDVTNEDVHDTIEPKRVTRATRRN